MQRVETETLSWIISSQPRRKAIGIRNEARREEASKTRERKRAAWLLSRFDDA